MKPKRNPGKAQNIDAAFPALLAAIIADDAARVRALLVQNPALATAGAPKPELSYQLGHWIYVGDTALHAAAAGARVEIVRLLLAAGANPGAAQNHRHSQPLHYAADGHPDNPGWDERRQVEAMKLLLEAGADLHARDKNGATPLHRAVRTRSAAAVKFLLAAGADATLRNLPGSTPFHLAVQNTGRGGSGAAPAQTAQREIIREFLKRGYRPTLNDAKNKSVLDWARSDWIRQLLTGNPS